MHPSSRLYLVAALCGACAAPALADSGGATGLNLAITDTTYALSIGGHATVDLRDSTSLDNVWPVGARWSDGTGNNGTAWQVGVLMLVQKRDYLPRG